MSIIPGLAGIAPIIQDQTLQRRFHDAVFPELLFRREASRELWEANQGDRLVKTRGSLLEPTLAPTPAGEDPKPVAEAFEQWSILARQYDKTIDTQMPTSRAALASKFARDAHTLGLDAGRSLNRLVRNKLYTAYVGGCTHADNAGPGTSLQVGQINGFQTVLDSEGQEQNVSPTYPLTIDIGGTAAVVVGATATDSNFPGGQGVLTLQASVAWSAGDVVKAANAPQQVFAGGSALSTDGLLATNTLDLQAIREAVAILQANNVPPHDDGFYHVHVDPFAVSQVYSDAEYQRVNEGRFDADPYARFQVGQLLSTLFYRNSVSPGIENATGISNALAQNSRPTDAATAVHAGEIGADVRNKTGVKILRTIVTGGGAIYEWYIPEADYLTEAGVTGKSGGFQQVSTNGMSVDVDGIRYTLRAPQDRKQQIVAQTWSWSGDWGIPSDQLGGRTSARFKRAVVINSGVAG